MSVAETHPHLLNEWHPTKNKYKLTQLTHGSDKRIWWQCPKDPNHVYETQVKHKAKLKNSKKKPTGCPFCKGRKVDDSNSLEKAFPEIAREWHPTKNKSKASQFTAGSSKKVWWKCEYGHEWESIISNRTGVNKRGCPYCAHQKVDYEFCLEKLFPDIACEWSDKNGSLTAKDVTAFTHKKVWWKCKKGHEYCSSIGGRTGKIKAGCPDCAGKVLKDNNRLSNTSFAKEWHPTKNGNKTPKDIFQATGKKYWWRCKKGHEWLDSANNRYTHKRGCPKCQPVLNQGYSLKQVDWLERISKQQKIDIIHKCNNIQEHKILLNDGKKIKVDGFCVETNTVYEYMGCFWHGHDPLKCSSKRKYHHHEINKCSKKTFGELYQKTKDRIELIKQSGFNLIVMWGCEYEKSLERKKNKQKYYNQEISFTENLFN